jgi:hypothetical protein
MACQQGIEAIREADYRQDRDLKVAPTSSCQDRDRSFFAIIDFPYRFASRSPIFIGQRLMDIGFMDSFIPTYKV